ncbi:MAG: M6 family metalloprotease domain-containing protein, partial [Prevotellaceae bacterium]|nr:M6 family metalloprotease domain-containing protein [Candidatus Faecinaster equi]
MRNLFIFSLLTLCIFIDASPVFRTRLNIKQSDGTTLNIIRTGNRQLSYFQTLDSIAVIENEDGDYCYALIDDDMNLSPSKIIAHDLDNRISIESKIAEKYKTNFYNKVKEIFKHRISRLTVGSKEKAVVPVIGNVNIPIVLVEFTDKNFLSENDSVAFDKHFNASNYQNENHRGSVRDYFIAQSDSLFCPHFDIVGKVKVSHETAYYGKNRSGDDQNLPGLFSEVLDLLDKKGVDFSVYANKDKIVPFIGLIYAGTGEQSSGIANDIWALFHPTLIKTLSNGIKVTSCLYVNELADYYRKGTPTLDGIGIFCHEFSHAMGLPDFYPTNGIKGVFGMDVWDLMDYGHFNNLAQRPMCYSAYEREFMEWIKIPELKETSEKILLKSLYNVNPQRAYKIYNNHNINEYYILEYRTASDWYLSNTLGTGMLITHVDYDRSAWISNSINNIKEHPRMTIIPADGVLTPQSSNTDTYKGDLYPGLTNNTELSHTTTPRDDVYIGSNMGIALKNIRKEGNDIVFQFIKDGNYPKGDINKDYVTDSNDIKVIYDYLLNKTKDYNLKDVDINNDGKSNTEDIITLYNII